MTHAAHETDGTTQPTVPVRVPFPSLWVCADLGALYGPSLVDRVLAVIDRTPAAVWIRAPIDAPARRVLDVARALRGPSRAAGGALVVGDRMDIATAVDADAVHLTSRSVSPAAAREWLSSMRSSQAMRLTRSVHDAASVDTSDGVDAFLLSPLAAVEAKAPPLGLAGFASVAAHAPGRPFVALGGIVDEATARLAARAGASAIAVRRALLNSSAPADECRALHRAFVEERAARRGVVRSW